MARGVIILLILLFPLNIFGNDLIKLIELRGKWNFAIGDDLSRAARYYDDSNWDQIKVPGSWEDNGYHGYNGFAWYRKTVQISETYRDIPMFLILGYIDDVDEVYFNGTKIGQTGQFPPDYTTAYSALRKYYIPLDLINFSGKNVISVRVYDSYLYGGILKGDVGIYTYKNPIPTDIGLTGLWNFKTGDNPAWKNKQYNDAGWDKIFVPAYWENQGYRDYDGFAWYRKEVFIPNNYRNEKMVLVLGRIDDLDEVFINGVLVGKTGEIYENTRNINTSQEYRALRGYYIPGNVLQYGQTNTIAVRIYDSWGEGGIYEGNIGLVRQSRYVNYWRNKR